MNTILRHELQPEPTTSLGSIEHPKKRAFLSAFAQTGCVSRAADLAGCSRNSHYNWLKTDAEYAVAFEDAEMMVGDLLESEAMRRATEGIEEQVIHRGQPCFRYVDEQGNDVDRDAPNAKKVPLTVRRYSDTLLIFLMKGRIPKRYGDWRRIEHSGPGGAPIQTTNESETLDFSVLTDGERLRLADYMERIQRAKLK